MAIVFATCRQSD